ncbi:MAG: hypothetical protein AAGA20_10045 [Planctomycetota bacterium]
MTIVVEGESFLAIETVAEVFHVDVVVLREAYAVGLLGRCLERERKVLVAARSLDRVARLVRMRAVLGLDLETIELAFVRDPDDV